MQNLFKPWVCFNFEVFNSVYFNGFSDYKERLGFRGRLLFEPNYEDFHNTCVQNVQNYFDDDKNYYRYDYDSTSAICFLKHFNLDKMDFKINSKPGHQMVMASM